MAKMTYMVTSTTPNFPDTPMVIDPGAYDNTDRKEWTHRLAVSYCVNRTRHDKPGTVHTILRRPEGSAEPWERAREYETVLDGCVKRIDRPNNWRGGGLALAL